MTDHNAILAMIRDNPADDTLRLVLADLLRESNNPDEQALGRFLWAGVTAFRLSQSPEDPVNQTALAEIVNVTHEGHPARWLADLRLGPSPLSKGDEAKGYRSMWSLHRRTREVKERIGVEAGADGKDNLLRGSRSGNVATFKPRMS